MSVNAQIGPIELGGRRALVVGLARSGVAAARLLRKHGASVVATDVKTKDLLGDDVAALAELGVVLELGGHRRASFTASDIVVVSPGVPWDLPELELARRSGASVVAEVELGARFVPGPIVAITGTKGKSTTTAALGAMLQAAGQDARVGGNIGRPLTDMLEGASANTRFVLELSSFQLEGTETLHAHVAIFLNLSTDHLDRHASYDDYARAKARIFRNQTPADWAVVNGDDPQVVELARQTRARVLRAELAPGNEPSAFFQDGDACLRLAGETETLFARASVRVPGAHLASDLLCAAAAARLMGAKPQAIASAVAAFDGVPHALERVAEVGGVTFFNDSKATNVDAAKRSFETFEGPLHAILGGRYKGGDFSLLRGVAAGRVRTVLAIGEARALIAAALSDVVPVTPCDSLREAVERAFAAAQPGDTVLLAPACSSFDMFQDYAARGDAFKSEVHRLAEQQGREERRG